jgi:phage terminase large subunit
MLTVRERPRTPVSPAQAAAYQQLREHWRRDPRRYVRQRFGVEPTVQQDAILAALAPSGAKVSVRSGHGVGKSACASWACWWFLECFDFAKVPCTAPTGHQLKDVLWGEISKWRRAADTQSEARGDHPRLWLSRLFRLTTDSLYDPGAREWAALARTAHPTNPDALQGFHAAHLLFILDEASGIAEPIFEVAEGSLTTASARVLMLGNPTRTSGTFYASHHADRGAWTALHFRSQDSVLTPPGYRARLVQRWGEGSNVVRVRADGEFPRQEDDILISLELTEPCLTRDPVPGDGLRKLGVDVAWQGNDRTALVLRHGRIVEHIALYAKQDPMQTTGRVVQVLEPWQVDEVCVDVIGLGAGVYSRLLELQRTGQIRCAVTAVNVAERAPRKTHQDDAQARLLRDYLWLEMARWLREEAPVFAAPDRQACEDLAGELASVKLAPPDSEGFLRVEPKDSMKKRLGHSPDLADALGCTLAPRPGPPPVNWRLAANLTQPTRWR